MDNYGIKSNLDKFYTKPEIALHCIDLAEPYLTSIDTVIEPSAGNGSFLQPQLMNQHNVVALDIAPESSNIQKCDFLDWKPSDDNRYAVIGNPPFGRRMAGAIAFFNHAAKFSEYICFIVPVTFMKWNTQKQLNQQFKLLYYEYLPENSFYDGNKEYNIRCVFQIWGKYGDKDYRLKSAPPISLDCFQIWQYNATPQSLNTIEEDWIYALYRQGRYDYNNIFTRKDYGRIKEEMTRDKQKRQFFFVKPLTTEAEKNFLSMDFNNLAARNAITPGFGKGDFISYYLELFGR